MKEKFDCLVKILLIGDSGVGKSCILESFEKGSFRVNHVPTIAIDFSVKIVKIGDQLVKMQVWDTAGQERFNTLTASFFKATHGILLTFSLTDKNSFANTSKWLQQIHAQAPKNAIIFLVGNKKDLEAERQVTREEAENAAKEYGVEYFETSACTGEGVNETFMSLGTKALGNIDRSSIKPATDDLLDARSSSIKDKCCSN